MSAALLRPELPRAIPWGNGLGISQELLGGQGWRISTTWIERDCGFSHYPGKQRTIVLLRGEGFRLDFGVHGQAEVSRPGVHASFMGEWPTRCSLVTGRVEVLNLVFEAELAPPAVRALQPGAHSLGPGALALFCVRGRALVDSSWEIAEGELLAVSTRGDGRVAVDSLSAELLLLELGIA